MVAKMQLADYGVILCDLIYSKGKAMEKILRT